MEVTFPHRIVNSYLLVETNLKIKLYYLVLCLNWSIQQIESITFRTKLSRTLENAFLQDRIKFACTVDLTWWTSEIKSHIGSYTSQKTMTDQCIINELKQVTISENEKMSPPPQFHFIFILNYLNTKVPSAIESIKRRKT